MQYILNLRDIFKSASFKGQMKDSCYQLCN